MAKALYTIAASLPRFKIGTVLLASDESVF